MLKNKTQDTKAHTSRGGPSKEKGVDVRAGPNTARPLNIYRDRGEKGALN